MKSHSCILLLFLLFLFGQACNTLYYSEIIDIEIMEPPKTKLPNEYKKIAVRYNNVNISGNTTFNSFIEYGQRKNDTENTDSIASKIYFDRFIQELHNQDYFDTILELAPNDFTHVLIADTFDYTGLITQDTTKNYSFNEVNVFLASSLFKHYPSIEKENADTLLMHNEFSLYTPNQLALIYDSTKADMLLSLDFFGMTDGKFFNRELLEADESVVSCVLWSFYDLGKKNYIAAFQKSDTISWDFYSAYQNVADRLLPPRKDAVFNAADIVAERFAWHIVPHWLPVQRMYYKSGHVELKKTNDLINQGKWLEAAKIWKANVNNPNKSIAAKSMFNMGLVCEISGNLEAAIGWVVESFYELGKNEIHADNCMQYIKILSKRKADKKVLDMIYSE